MKKWQSLLLVPLLAGSATQMASAQDAWSLKRFIDRGFSRSPSQGTRGQTTLTPWGDDLVNPELGYVPGEVLIKFRPGRPYAVVREVQSMVGAAEIQTFPDIGVRHWRLAGRRSPIAAIEALSESVHGKWIEYAEPNYIWHVNELPNDPMRGSLWGMHQVYNDFDIDALEAWAAGYTGSNTVVVGVIDTGIDYNHPDLAANVWVNPGETPGDGIDNDGNGYVDDIHGADFVNLDGDPMDDNGHGTHTSGTIGAAGNNGVGVMGVTWNVRLMGLKFLSAGGSGSTSNAILAINYAKAKGAVITNNSWGGGSKSNALSAAIASSNALFVASAGNSSTSTKQYPAGYDAANILSVAATESNDGLAYYSNFSSTWVDLGAPGSNVFSTLPSGGYGSMSGTSMAGPHVAGAAALLWAHTASPTVSSVKSQLMATIDPLASLAGKCVTGGRLNVAGALGAPPLSGDTIPPDPVSDLSATVNEQGDVVVSWTATGDDGSNGIAYVADLRCSTMAPITEANFIDATPAEGEPCSTAGTVETFVLPGARPGDTVYLALKVIDKSGNVSTLSNSASVTMPPGLWEIRPLPGGYGSSYIGFDYHPVTGHPGVAFGSDGNNTIWYSEWDGTAWSDLQAVRSGYSGVSFAFDPNLAIPSLSSVPGKLYFSSKPASVWTSVMAASGNNGRDISSLDYDLAGNPGIAYRANGLYYAYRSGGVWSSQVVHSGAGARYMCLTYDASGRPGIAYSGDANSDGWLDSIWYAHHDGSAWSYQMVESGPTGYGVHSAIAYNPVTGYPALSHKGANGAIRFLWWNGSTWIGETPFVSPDGYAWSSSIDFRSDGTAVFASDADGWMRVFFRNPTTGEWTMEKVMEGGAFLFRVRVGSDGRVGLVCNDYEYGLSYAERYP